MKSLEQQEEPLRDHPLAWSEDGVELASREDDGEFITRWACRYNLPIMVAMDALAEAAERFGVLGGGARPESHERKILTRFVEFNRVLQALPVKDLDLGRKCLTWVFDISHLDNLLRNTSPADWWRASGRSKFLVYKLADGIRRELRLPLRRDQRTESTRARQRQVRRGQLVGAAADANAGDKPKS